jgi:ferredoxin
MTTGTAGKAGLAGRRSIRGKRNVMVKVQIDADLCQGHGRCYELSPALFVDDQDGFGQVLRDGAVAPEREADARRAALNCPERAIELIEGT